MNRLVAPGLCRASATSARALALAVAATALAACAMQTRQVERRMLLPATGAQHVVASSELFVMPIELTSPEPVFPVEFSATDAMELTVCAEVWLSDEGSVDRVVPLRDGPGCTQPDPAARLRRFEHAVTDALQRWEFSPARICILPPEAVERRERGDCTGPDVVLRPVPVRVAYAFTFSMRNGRRQVARARQTRDAP